MRRLLVVVIVLFCLALLVAMATKDDGARPRYLSAVLLPLACLAGAGALPAIDALRASLGRRATLVVVALVGLVMPSLQIAWVLDARMPALAHREGLYESVARMGARDAVVIVRHALPHALHAQRLVRRAGPVRGGRSQDARGGRRERVSRAPPVRGEGAD